MATLLAAVGSAFSGGGISLAQGLQIGGTLLSAGGAIAQGNAAKSAAEYNAAQLEAQGKAENAQAQREAQEQRRQKELMLSRARAVAGASGGGQDYQLLGDIEEDGTYNELTALWQGEERRKGRSAQAASSRFEGINRRKASLFNATGTLLSGAHSFYSQYG